MFRILQQCSVPGGNQGKLRTIKLNHWHFTGPETKQGLQHRQAGANPSFLIFRGFHLRLLSLTLAISAVSCFIKDKHCDTYSSGPIVSCMKKFGNTTYKQVQKLTLSDFIMCKTSVIIYIIVCHSEIDSVLTKRQPVQNMCFSLNKIFLAQDGTDGRADFLDESLELYC